MLNRKRNKVALAIALVAGLSTAAYAQTSSSLRGKVESTTGVPVTDAVVTIKHTPTGTTRKVVIDGTGVFSASCLLYTSPSPRD